MNDGNKWGIVTRILPIYIFFSIVFYDKKHVGIKKKTDNHPIKINLIVSVKDKSLIHLLIFIQLFNLSFKSSLHWRIILVKILMILTFTKFIGNDATQLLICPFYKVINLIDVMQGYSFCYETLLTFTHVVAASLN